MVKEEDKKGVSYVIDNNQGDISYRAFFFNDTATTEIYTLSLHDALPIWGAAYERTPLHSGKAEILTQSCIVGQRNHSVLARRLAPTRLVGIKFKPGA